MVVRQTHKNNEDVFSSPVADGGGARAAGGGGQARPHHKEVAATTTSTDRARELRNNATPPERILWRYLRGKQIEGLKFRRQHPIGPFIADFYCHERSVVVEIDGDSHLHDQKQHDVRRDEWMETRRFRVIRVAAREIFSNVEGVVRTIQRELTSQTPSVSCADTSPVGDGGGE